MKINNNDTKISRATIKDVAIKANVSLSTVSRVLRNPEKTPAATVHKVMEAVKSLNYVYNATAGSLSGRRSNTIGVMLPSPAYSAFGINLLGIQDICSARNYSCRVASSQFLPEEERIALHRFHEQRIDGLILCGLDKNNVQYVRNLEKEDIPCIVLWEIPDENLNYIGIDNERSAYVGMRYLMDLGHRRIGLLLGPIACASRNFNRLVGYKKALAEVAVPFDEELVRVQPPSFLLGKESMRAFLKLREPPTAVLCANDYLAIGAIRAITETGLNVPNDISVCGFDDVDVAAYCNPPLTTIKTPCYQMGKMAAEMIIDSLETQKPLRVQYVLDTELVVRATCNRPMNKVKMKETGDEEL